MDNNFRDRLPRVHTETYTTGHAHSWIYNALPSPLTSLYSLLAAGSVTGLAYFFGNMFGGEGGGDRWMMFVIAGMTAIAAMGFIFSARRAKRAAKARATGLDNAIKGSTAGWDTGDGDAQELVKRDELRKKFQQGIDVFAQHGKSLYDLPWYVMVGETSAGKSEAIRRSELRFPEGLHEKQQGVGGTQLMNWWFTNNAVILDTAGALLMDPEAAQRFADFLGLLRTHRADYPINGLILTLPVDKLLTDTPAIVEEKAALIAEQLKIIQKALDVRFPLYVMVSKSDRLPGFKEFVDAEGQVAFHAEMLGWSNPAPLDEPFAAAQIDDALECIVSRLRGRVLNIVADPVPRLGLRRTDEVDTIYGFPEMLRSLAPRLQCYLDLFFQSGAWASKPPFFRGIYFTSALRQGGELDKVLGEALGMDPNLLGKASHKVEKSVFLRDLFLNKIFLEKGLVTRLKNVGALLRRRLVAFFLITLGLVVLGLIVAFNVRAGIKAQLLDEQSDWIAANQTWDNGVMLPLIARNSDSQGRPFWKWVANSRDSKEVSRFELVKRLMDKTSKPLRNGWVFKPLPQWQAFEDRRRSAALTVFEASVIKPLLDAARERILWDTANASSGKVDFEALAQAYEQLVLLEAWTTAPGRAQTNPRLANPTTEMWKEFYENLLAYALGRQAYEAEKPAVADMAALTSTVYHDQATLHARQWTTESSQGMENSALAASAKMLFGTAAPVAAASDAKRAQRQQDKQAQLDQFKAVEKRLLAWSNDTLQPQRNVVERDGLAALRLAAAAYDQIRAVDPDAPSANVTTGEIEKIAKTTVDVLEVVADGSPLSPYRAAAAALSGKKKTTTTIGDVDVEWVAAKKRLENYEAKFSAISAEDVHLSTGDMLGQLIVKLNDAAAQADQLGSATLQSTKPTVNGGPPTNSDEDNIAKFLGQFRGDGLVPAIFQKYRYQLETQLRLRLKFPLVTGGESSDTLREVSNDSEILNRIEADSNALAAASHKRFNVPERDILFKRFVALKPVFSILKTLTTQGGLQLQIIGSGAVTNTSTTPSETKSTFFKTTTIPGSIKTEKVGLTNITISIGGHPVSWVPSGESPPYPWNGFDDVEIEASIGVSGTTKEQKEPLSYSRLGLMREIAKGTTIFPIGRSGASLKVISNPPLPSVWPTRTNFGPE